MEPLATIARKIELVDRHRHLPQAQERQDVGMPPRLLPDALGPVHQEDRGVGGRRAGDHVLEELLVAGGVDDDVGALRRAEEGLRRVDRDVLFPLLLEGVHQVREFELPPLLAAAPLDLPVPFDGQRAGVVEEPPDQGGLAVVHVAHDDDAQSVLYLHGCPYSENVWVVHM
jgi:hypothetical protein